MRRFIDMNGKVSLYYNQITIGLQSGYNQLHHHLHFESTQYKQFPQKKKEKKSRRRKQKTKEKDRMKGRRKKGKR